MTLPIVVTHPCTLFHNGLRQLFAGSRFRPLRISTSLTNDLEKFLLSQSTSVWLTGVERCPSTTNELVKRITAANSGVKAVVLGTSQKPEEIIAALRAGAHGFLRQEMSGERLLRCLELIAMGEMIVYPRVPATETSANELRTFNGTKGLPLCEKDASESGTGEMRPTLSRRETLILRLLMNGSSNKMIARNLVITESTVKVHMKAILRKLRLQNRTQAAMWARNHISETDLSHVNGVVSH